MFRKNFSGDQGSAVLEFIAFVLVGQLLVFGWSISVAASLSDKVSLQLAAIQVANNLAHGSAADAPDGTSLKETSCLPNLVCISLSRDRLTALAVAYR